MNHHSWYEKCPNNNPVIDYGHAAVGAQTPVVIPWNKPTDNQGNYDQDCGPNWETTTASDFLALGGDYLGKITKYAFIVMYNLGASTAEWYSLQIAKPNFALIGNTDDKDAPDTLDGKDRLGAAITEDYFVLLTHELEFVVYTYAGLDTQTPQDNDVAGTSRWVNSKHDWIAQLSIYRAWQDEDSNGFASFREAYNYAADHITTTNQGVTPAADAFRLDDDQLKATWNGVDWETSGHMAHGWYDGRNVATWYL